ncbi:MAG: 2-succinyl-5-enolpyruvyl-6-hydroxy-3-cyclohexene-1-carboxylic-acid synthase, partial [Acidimicrobiales bacterium]|nr:2-succinyl-5-enolpyruvyl-6-hydroxy-3-cyclohexene-1-carboxylic-acid synthase [Acidimicrobiales bacterium]
MTWIRPQDVQAAFCAVVCDEWARAGVTDAVVAPGSRSTPMVVALDEEERIRVHVVLDERSAGFVALGLALAGGRPAVVVTTSGTASVELHPAVVEAAQAGVPLIAVTTDRPPELHHVAAPQTVEQRGLFVGAAWELDPGPPDPAMSPEWRSIAARTVQEALEAPGPVHLNLPFREPLLGRPGSIEVPPGRPGGRPWHAAWRPEAGTPPQELVELLAGHAGGRGLIVAGAGAGPGALELGARLGWPVLADPRSGARLPSPCTIAAGDALLRHRFPGSPPPDVVLRVGAPWASKVVSQWLAALPPETTQVLVDHRTRWADPERQAAYTVPTTPAAIVEALETPVPERPSGWLLAWQDGERRAQGAFEGLLKKGALLDMSEPALARSALAGLAEGGVLFVSSSMPVRDVEWFGAPRRGAVVLSNRGANGIDGVLSTAIGA